MQHLTSKTDKSSRAGYKALSLNAPAASFIICTKDRPQLLSRCLATVVDQLTKNQEIIVVDNSVKGSALPVAKAYGARWIKETRPGAGWTRNRGFQEAKSDIVVYLDDDCQADVVWARELLEPFEDATVGIVTGSVLAARADLALPWLIDAEYSFHRGWQAVRYAGSTGTKWSPYDIWRVGVGGTMAWRKSLLEEIGGFDPALGAGTPAGSCEDIDAFRRALCSGAVICYQPTALVWHKHPEYMHELSGMLIRYAVTLGAHTAKMALEEGQWRGLFYLFQDWGWQVRWALKLLLASSKKRSKVQMPALALLLQPPASISGMFRFVKYRRQLRNGEVLPEERRKKTVSNDSPLMSGVSDLQMELNDILGDQVTDATIRLILRIDRRPVYATEITAGKRISEVLKREMPDFFTAH